MSSPDTVYISSKDDAREALPSALRRSLWPFVAVIAWAIVSAISVFLPNVVIGFAEPLYVRETNGLFIGWTILLAVGAALVAAYPAFGKRLVYWSPWLTALAVFFGVWELLTAKFAWLPVPFFQPPSSLLEVYLDDWPRLLDSLYNSFKLLASGFVLGAIAGFLTGVSIGWVQAIGYWVHPVLRFLGPIPSTALLPMAFYFFPSGFSAAVFLIALATWFPLTVLTWSGVASVDKAYYDVARTLGASQLFLILRVAIPAALPHVFVGLFMGLGASFSVLVAAEMMGVKSGLGWYLHWAQGWAAYNNLYGALIIMAIVFSGLITLLFTVRDRVLTWQKGDVKW